MQEGPHLYMDLSTRKVHNLHSAYYVRDYSAFPSIEEGSSLDERRSPA